MKPLIRLETAEKITNTTMHVLDRVANLLVFFAVPAAAYVIACAIAKVWGM